MEAAVNPRRNVAQCAAARAVEQHAIDRIAKASPRGREPEIFGLALRTRADIAAERARFFAVNPGAVEIRLDAVDKAVGLEIGPNCGSNEKAGEVETASRTEAGEVVGIGPIAGAEAVAQVEAKIDTAPVVDWRNRGNISGWGARWCRRRARWRKIRGKRVAGCGKCQRSGQDPSLHATPQNAFPAIWHK